MTIETEHEFFDVVYLKSDREQLPRIIKTFQIMPGGLVNYELECGDKISWHYSGSISKDNIDFNKKAGFKN